jgi:hypothetical protein
MIRDTTLDFIPLATPLSLVAGAGISIPSPNIIDILGTGVGTPPQNIIGNRAIFGQDSGIGGKRPMIDVAIGTAPTTSTSATLNAAFQAAPDTGVSGGYLPGTWQTLEETGALTVAQLLANTVFMRFDWAAAFPASLVPRFYRLLFQIPSGADFTAGTIAYAITTMVRDDWSIKYATKNYNV